MQTVDHNQTRHQRWVYLALALVLVVALWLRLTGIDWDDLYHLHPDERYIVWVGTTVEWPSDWGTALDPELSTFNPFHWPPEASSQGIRVQQGEPRDYAYGHWPLYLGVAAQHLLAHGQTLGHSLPESWTLARDLLNAPGRIEYRHLLLVGRALAALFDTLTVGLVFLLARRLFGPLAGLLAAAMLALAVIHIQSAHFFITDPFLTTAVVAAVYWMVRRVESGRWRDSAFAGALMGLAVGAKFSAVMLVLALALALVWDRRVAAVAGRAGWRQLAWQWLRRPLLELAFALFIGLAVFAITNPFALLDTTCRSSFGPFSLPGIEAQIGPITVPSCYLENIGTQATMVRGGPRIPFTLQYVGTAPYLYFLFQMGRWGLGISLTVVLFAGLAWAVWRLLPGRRRAPQQPADLVLLAWALPFFIVTGSFQVKFLRYLLPLIPFLTVFGAGMVLSVARRPYRLGLAALVLVTSGLWAAAFVGMYGSAEHPWVEASRWIDEHIPADSVVATEHWDHTLPLPLRDVDGPALSEVQLEWFYVEDPLRSEENRVELSEALETVAGSDYLILASNRLYGVIPRLPGRYPAPAAYYRLLFAGRLGFELVHWSGRYPALGSVTLVDDTFQWPRLSQPEPLADWRPGDWTLSLGPADESFTVYDHPLVLIFANRDHLTGVELERLVRAEAAE